ncbi:MAG TPA: ferrochelatase [Acidimicrobiales bacterium]|nr:ferrochelatase [Acidimicrobiales bacterium]
MGEAATIGVLVMAYGSPASPADIEAYYTHVRRGRPPPPQLLDDLERRYDAIGGMSPLMARTSAQVEALQAALGPGHLAVLGQKHAAPFLEDGVARLAGEGVGRIVGLVLAPHASVLSTGEYHSRAAAAAGAAGVAYAAVEPWYDHPALVEILSERVTQAAARFPAGTRFETLVTAHSLPLRALELDEPSYPEQLRRTGEAVAARAGLGPRWRIAWQSAGRTADPWIGPDILDVIRSLPAEGVEAVVVCPAGFASDHLEVLYDVDIEARRVATEAGLLLERTGSLNDDPRFISLLASLVGATTGGARS